ncbi:MAG: LytTR family DNA-binding domain-containing protein, partial [Oscillospiraceae bacterium]|nr:LytTR family DNA-binding domain-containing protein [Oscillospiraceae bacterium]
MHLILVEDLDMDRERLAELIRSDCALRRENVDLSFYAGGEEFLAQYRPQSCDGIFLDILLGGVSGIKVAERVREQEPRLPVIFTTTEPDFALDGFSVHAMDYLLKPLSQEKVSWCLEQLREYLAVPSSIPLLE